MKISKKVLSLLLAALMIASCISVGVVSVSAAIGDTVYLKNSAGWSNPSCYMWKGGGGAGNENHAWPGIAMTALGDDVYSYTLTDDYTYVIFNGGGNQTGDLDYPGNNQIYDNKTGQWSVFNLDAAEPSVSASKKNGSTFKTATVDVTVTATNADTSTYSVDGDTPVSFDKSAVVTMGAYTPIDGTTSITVTATNKNGTVSETYTYTKKAASQGGGDDGSTTPAETGKFGTNPNGAVGKQATITIDGDFSDWSEDMLIAQGAAWDVANHFKGGHENCVLDTYSLYGAWDNDNLYIGWQMVNTTDTWAREGDGPLSDGGRVLDVPLILALSLDESTTKMSNKNTDGNPIWGQKMGLTFTTHVDRLLYMSGKPGLGEPSMFSAVDESGNTNYSSGCVGFSKGGIEYKMAEGCLPSSIIGLNYSEDPADVYNEEADWVDYKTFKGNMGTHDTQYDSFYEIKIPLSTLDIDADYLKTNGIGAMLVATRGESGIDCIPHDPSMLDNAMDEYGADSSTSHEKDDEDDITVPFARIGKLLGGGSTPIIPSTEPQTRPSTQPATDPETQPQSTAAQTEPITTKPQPTDPVTEPETQPQSTAVTDPITTKPQPTDPVTEPATDPKDTQPATNPVVTDPTPSTETKPSVGDYMFYVVGDQQLLGTSWAKSAENGMTAKDGVYYLTKHNCPAGKYEFKIVDSFDNWHPDGTNNNSSVIVPIEGLDVTFCYDPAQGYGIASTSGEPTYPTEATDATEVKDPTVAPTTEPQPTVCNHSHTKTTTKAATYFAKGKKTVTCKDCGKVLKTTPIAKKVLKTPSVTIKGAKKSIKVTLKKKVKDATGFIVQYKEKGKKKVVTKKYKTNKKVTKVINKLKKNKKYTVQVRAYVQKGKKIAYSKWTKPKTVKTK